MITTIVLAGNMFKDYRLKENRREGFKKYFYGILKTEEYDPFYYTANYLYERFDLNKEQMFWFSWLYGFIYNGATAWVVFNEFPDFENVDVDRLKEWEIKNYKRMQFETDTRHKKCKIHEAFVCYKKAVGNKTQEEFFNTLCCYDDPKVNFRILWDYIRENFYLFGRYSTFFYTETLKRCNGLNIECDSLFLEDIPGSKSHRNGLCYVLGKDEWDLSKKNTDFKYESWMIEYLKEEGDKIIKEMKVEFPDVINLIDYFSMETALCAYKGFFRKRRYFGFYLDRDCSQIKFAESKCWNGIDWNVFWQCRKECLREELLCENKNYFEPKLNLQELFLQQGIITNLHLFFDDDEYKETQFDLF